MLTHHGSCVSAVIDRNWIGLIFIFYDFANHRWDWTTPKSKRSTNWNNDCNRNWSCWWHIRANSRCRWRHSTRGNARSWRIGCHYGGLSSSKRSGSRWLTGVPGPDMIFQWSTVKKTFISGNLILWIDEDISCFVANNFCNQPLSTPMVLSVYKCIKANIHFFVLTVWNIPSILMTTVWCLIFRNFKVFFQHILAVFQNFVLFSSRWKMRETDLVLSEQKWSVLYKRDKNKR